MLKADQDKSKETSEARLNWSTIAMLALLFPLFLYHFIFVERMCLCLKYMCVGIERACRRAIDHRTPRRLIGWSLTRAPARSFLPSFHLPYLAIPVRNHRDRLSMAPRVRYPFAEERRRGNRIGNGKLREISSPSSPPCEIPTRKTCLLICFPN